MSRQAIAAVLARDDLSSGERLVAFSLASFADRENRARPGTPAAAERAGLKRSWFLEARDTLVRRGLVVVEQAAAGRGWASTVWLPFADAGPWWEGEINARLLETVLGYSRSRGTARLLLAAMAALADEQGVVEGVTTERLCAAACVTDRTYRRARAALLSSSELVLRGGTGGRGNTNCWEIADPIARAAEAEPVNRRRVPPPAGQRPVVASVPALAALAVEQAVSAGVEADRSGSGAKGGRERTVSAENRPVRAGVSVAKGGAHRTVSAENRPVGAGVLDGKGGGDRTLSRETPAKTPAETPAPNARAGREPQNPRTVHPPSPPEGGSVADELLVEETFLTERGRKRRRLVAVDLAAVRERLAAAGAADRARWEEIRAVLLQAVGERTFEIWLAPLGLIAVDRDGSLVIATPEATRGWVRARFGRVLEGCAAQAGCAVRFAEEHERRAFELRPGDAPPAAPVREEGVGRAGAAGTAPAAPRLTSVSPACAGRASADRCGSGLADPASDRSGDWHTRWSSDGSAYTSTYAPSDVDVYTPRREVT